MSTRRSPNRLELTGAERAEVAALVDEVGTATHGQHWDPLALAGSATTHAQRLPLRLRQFLCDVRENEADIAMVSNLPIDPGLAPTPAGWDVAAKTGAGRREELTLLLVGAGLAEPFGWANQQDGRVVHDVCPVPGQEAALTSASSEIELSLHTEDVYHPCRGDYVSLFCLRNPDEVGTTVVRVADLEVPQELREALRRTEYRFYADDSHAVGFTTGVGPDNHLDGRPYERGSVLFGPHERPYLRFDIDFMSAEAGSEPTDAIHRTQRMFGDVVDRVALAPGDAIFVDNYQVVHGREPFTPRYDGHDRWLKRLNLIRDVRRIYASSDRRNRIIL
ncbi:hypothetical protein ALI22I_17660 [Saccharothrix sp. ALI-22-I]|uniref:TauD/TfdA family dioxygenase n=1 Tax=Saccharothrix sp. ALI-22-I TaxID=1933778 RepID=UPI00097BD9CF|nr:TauD/TfdA family dioxygenase [Saccharothrix sp. ALI-22-I]ONI88802.1 hypothetical protein ALI22I_17660 [Saccharothrix sp. ALI-22-I]